MSPRVQLPGPAFENSYAALPDPQDIQRFHLVTPHLNRPSRLSISPGT